VFTIALETDRFGQVGFNVQPKISTQAENHCVLRGSGYAINVDYEMKMLVNLYSPEPGNMFATTGDITIV
jgi:hypothetical protein